LPAHFEESQHTQRSDTALGGNYWTFWHDYKRSTTTLINSNNNNNNPEADQCTQFPNLFKQFKAPQAGSLLDQWTPFPSLLPLKGHHGCDASA